MATRDEKITPEKRKEYGVLTISRDQFFSNYWHYDNGDHVTILCPTGGGKTQLAYQLLGATASPDLQAAVLVMKPKDDTVMKFSARYKFKTTRVWPPPQLVSWAKKPPGWVLWPTETDDPELDDRRHAAIFRRCLRMQYRGAKKHPNITFADETYSLENELKLETELRRMWTKGRSVGAGLWAASQRPVWISRWAFQAQHLFLGFDPDKDMQKRYGEIGGGIDADVVRRLTAGLERYEFVYVDTRERAMCVIGAN
jgi:hypothetical protein